MEPAAEFDRLSDAELAIQCGGRPVQEEAFAAFYRRFYRDIVKQISATGGSLVAGEIDDLTQEAFVRIFKSLPRYNPERAGIKTYINRVTNSVVVDFFRHGSLERANTVSIENYMRVLNIHAQHDGALLTRAAERILKRIGDPQKAAIARDLLSGIEANLVAQRNGVKPNQVYSCRALLRDLLRELAAELPGGVRK